MIETQLIGGAVAFQFPNLPATSGGGTGVGRCELAVNTKGETFIRFDASNWPAQSVLIPIEALAKVHELAAECAALWAAHVAKSERMQQARKDGGA